MAEINFILRIIQVCKYVGLKPNFSFHEKLCCRQTQAESGQAVDRTPFLLPMGSFEITLYFQKLPYCFFLVCPKHPRDGHGQQLILRLLRRSFSFFLPGINLFSVGLVVSKSRKTLIYLFQPHLQHAQ